MKCRLWDFYQGPGVIQMLRSPGLQFTKKCPRELMDGLQEVHGPLALYTNCVLSVFAQVEGHIIKILCYRRPHYIFHQNRKH